MSTMSTLSTLNLWQEKILNPLLCSKRNKKKNNRETRLGLTWLAGMTYSDLSFLKMKGKKYPEAGLCNQDILQRINIIPLDQFDPFPDCLAIF
jgi:hypothetical protein